MSLRALFLAGVLTLPALAACSRVADHTALPATSAEVDPVQTPDLAGGPDAVGDAAQRAAMDAAVATALADAEAARTPPVRLIISNTPIPNPGDPVRPAGVLRIAMATIPDPEPAPRSAPALLGAPEGDPAPAMELAGAPEKPKHVGAMAEAATRPAPRPAAKPAAPPAQPRHHATLVAAAPKPAAAPAPEPEAAPVEVAAIEAPPPPATPMEAVLGTAAPPPPEDVQMPRVAAGVTPADTDGPMSPLVWLSGLAVVVVGGVFAAVRLIRRDRDREPLRA